MAVIPSTYEEWKHCITVECDVPLTPNYVAQRIAELSDADDFKTQRVIDRWGRQHHAQTLQWFHQAAAELQA